MPKRFKSQWAQLSECYKVLPPKLSLVLQESREPTAILRCGVILSANNVKRQSKFLSSLLADVYSSDQAWFNTMANRYSTSPTSQVFVRFGEQFDMQRERNYTKFVIPSPFLKDHKVEFLEMQTKQSQGEDGCHLYINLDGNDSMLARGWPTIVVQDCDNTNSLPLSNQINLSQAFEAISNFIKDKNTVTSYLQGMEKSNFANFKKKLSARLNDRKVLFSDLESSVLQNILINDKTLAEDKRMQSDKQEMTPAIEQWSQLAHNELQTKVKPLLENFAREQLSIWKIYTYSESKLKLKLIELVTKPIRCLQMVRSLYTLRGHLQIDDTMKSSLLEMNHLENKITSAQTKINKTIYHNFLTLQLPLIVCATLGIVSDQFSAYSMGALASFGVILGFKRVISDWQVTLKKILADINESIRRNIESNRDNLIQRCRASFALKESQSERKTKIIKAISENLDKD